MRDLEIYQRWKDGEKLRHIAKEYRLSAERIRQICKRQTLIESTPEGVDELYHLLIYKYAYRLPNGRISSTPRFVYRYVANRWNQDHNEGNPSVDYFLSIDAGAIRDVRGIGKAGVAFILRVQDIIRRERQML